MKYIDADKIRSEVERIQETGCASPISVCNDILSFIDFLQQEQPEQKKKCNDCPHCIDRKDQYGWHFKGCFGGPYKGKFIAEIDECPLEQEQPEVEFEDKFAKFIEKKDAELGANTWSEEDLRELALYFYYSRNEDKQPEVDLEKEIATCWQNWLSPSNQKDVEGVLPKTEFAMYARHFAQWCADHTPLPEDTVLFQKGMEEGKRLMMEEAVEGFVAAHLTSEGTKITVNSGYLPKEMCIKPGEKVRIIVCKKED